MRRLSHWLLLFFVFTIPWQNAVVIGGTRTMSSVLGAVALVVAIVACLLRGKMARPRTYVFAFGALVIWESLTYFWSLDQAATFSRLMTMVQLLAMVWLITELCESERDRLRVMQAFVLGCVVLCAVLIQAYLSGQAMDGFRYTSPDFNPNEAADTIAVGIPMALLVAISRSRSLVRWLNVLYVPLAVFGVILTASRGGFIATCIALLSVFFALRRVGALWRIAWSIVIVGSFAALFFAVPIDDGLQENIARITFSGDTGSLSTLTGRTAIWGGGLEMFNEHPVGGVGFGAYPVGLEAHGLGARAAHNVWVEVAAETGIVGLLLLTVVLATAIVPALRWRDGRRGFHVVLFGVLMAESLALNVVAGKPVWLGLAILSATFALTSHAVEAHDPGSETISSVGDLKASTSGV